MTSMTDLPSTINVRPPVWALILAVVIGGGFYIAGKNVEARIQDRATISVTGESKTSVAPDIAELTFGMTSGRQPTAKAAMAKLATDMTKIIAAVKEMGIEEKDIRTQSLWLNPVYDYMEGRTIPRGFEVTQQLVVKVRDLDRAGDVLTAATNAGANQVGGVEFRIDDLDAARAKARGEAITEAKEKARKLASDLGVGLGKLMGFSEGGMSPPIMYSRDMEMKADVAMGAPSVPLPPGEQDISVQVTLTYEIQ